MNFPTIGMRSMYDVGKTMKLEMKWQERKRNAATPQEKEMVRLQEDAWRARESNAISSIDAKLKAGGQLTEEELNYLKVKSPELYQKALEARREREQYKKELESCKTKDDVERLNMQKMQRYVAESDSICNNANIPLSKKLEYMDQMTRRVMATRNEHVAFVKSGQYKNLPTEQEELDRIEQEREQLLVQPAEEEQETEAVQPQPGEETEQAPPEEAAQPEEQAPARPESPQTEPSAPDTQGKAHLVAPRQDTAEPAAAETANRSTKSRGKAPARRLSIRA